MSALFLQLWKAAEDTGIVRGRKPRPLVFGKTLRVHEAAVPSGSVAASLSPKTTCFGGAGCEVMGQTRESTNSTVRELPVGPAGIKRFIHNFSKVL